MSDNTLTPAERDDVQAVLAEYERLNAQMAALYADMERNDDIEAELRAAFDALTRQRGRLDKALSE